MNMFLMIFYLVFCVFGLIYFIIIVAYATGWFTMKPYKPSKTKGFVTKTSIIVPARNEENNILQLLKDLVSQTVHASIFEIIVVDDLSSDNTVSLVRNFIAKNPNHSIKLLVQSDHETHTPFKKKAIQQAIEESSGDLIITTDADCRVGEKWLETLLGFYEENKPSMMVGPVNFHNEKTLFEKMQTPEFLSLIAITAGAIQIGRPIMCNGANLAYEKKMFYKAGGYGDDKFSSGDDVFLMLRLRRLPGNHTIRFVKNANALVFTEAQKNVKEFYHQRTRWASKNKGYDLNILFVSATVYMVNLLLVAGLITGIFIPALLPFVLWAALTKALVDVPVVIGISTFVNRSSILLYAFPLIILYPFYIVVTGAMGIFGSYNWKERKVKN